MQLKKTRCAWPFAALAAWTLVTVSRPEYAGATEPNTEASLDGKVPAAPKASASLPAAGIEDTSTKRASMEIASYADSDHVTVFTPSITASVENVTDGASLTGTYLVDVVSAASVDIVSTASRQWHEVRQAGTVAGTWKPKEFGVTLLGGASSEPDYFAYNAGLELTRDFDEKNLTVLFGAAYGHDTAGRSGTSFSVFSRELDRGSFSLGVTRLLDRASVLSIALDTTVEKGDQSKPYRYIPMFAPDVAQAAARGASIAWVNQYRLPERPLEQLPLARERFAISGKLAHRFEASTLHMDERLYSDTWGLHATTTDVRWIKDLGRRFAVWPHARFHLQNGVSFWQRAYTVETGAVYSLPEFRTGDRELGPLFTASLGGGIKWFFGPSIDPHAWSLGFQADAMTTSFQDALYITSRNGLLGSFSVEGEL